MKKRLIALAIFLSLSLLTDGCARPQSFDASLSSIVKPYRFSIARWEALTLTAKASLYLSGRPGNTVNKAEAVKEYFSISEQIRTMGTEMGAVKAGKKQGSPALIEAELDKLQEQKLGSESGIEGILKQQIRETLAEQRIFNPLVKLRVSFPPVDFKFESPPRLLVISPRNKIGQVKTVLLNGSLNLETIKAIEAEVDKLNVSSLVVDLGGLATYPAILNTNTNLQFILETAAHEWTHAYLSFTPLGFLYLLDIVGLTHNPDIVTINETVANIAGKELGNIVLQKYYPEADSNSSHPVETAFARELREVRKTVDRYLASGEVDDAEKFMQEKRDYLETIGYHIRKLNQAYFAFNGQYADVPAFSNPIGTELRQLRAESLSLKDFLDTAASITSLQDLKNSLEDNKQLRDEDTQKP